MDHNSEINGKENSFIRGELRLQWKPYGHMRGLPPLARETRTHLRRENSNEKYEPLTSSNLLCQFFTLKPQLCFLEYPALDQLLITLSLCVDSSTISRNKCDQVGDLLPQPDGISR